MDEQKQGLSVARLIDREKYYKEKALKLEKNMIFSSEKVTTLEDRLESLISENKTYNAAKQKAEDHTQQVQSLYDQLRQQYDKEVESHRLLEAELNDELTLLKKNQRSGSDVDRGAYEQRMKSYERLLAEVQNDINERDKELDVYKKRLSVMEKRLRMQGDKAPSEHPNVDDKADGGTAEHRALPYIDYAIILGEKRCVIRGDLVVENVGKKSLDTPYVCFRFTPGEAAELKGKILSWESADRDSLDQERQLWAFLDTDWAEEAKERGELWVYPTASVSLPAGEKVILSDLQIPIDQKYYEQIAIEVFVYFQESNYRVKAVNQILINF